MTKHKGIGGLFFIFSSIACSFIVIWLLQVSWVANVVGMADNFAHIVSVNSAVKSYISNTEPFSGDNIKIQDPRTGGVYDPLLDFNRMVLDSHIATSGSLGYHISWSGRRLTIQFYPFQTKLGMTVKPHERVSAIENK